MYISKTKQELGYRIYVIQWWVLPYINGMCCQSHWIYSMQVFALNGLTYFLVKVKFLFNIFPFDTHPIAKMQLNWLIILAEEAQKSCQKLYHFSVIRKMVYEIRADNAYDNVFLFSLDQTDVLISDDHYGCITPPLYFILAASLRPMHQHFCKPFFKNSHIFRWTPAAFFVRATLR